MNRPLCILLGAILFSLIGTGNTYAAKGLTGELEYYATYESNIFHAHDDSLETDDQMNDLTASLMWKAIAPSNVQHSVSVYSDLNLYISKTSRNRASFGFKYEPLFRYSKSVGLPSGVYARVKLIVDVSRRSKDLVDDSGQILARTLKQNIYRLGASHLFKIGWLSSTQAAKHVIHDYDEVFVGNSRQASYNYSLTEFELAVRAKVAQALKVSAQFETEKRFYDQRRTLSLDKKSSRIRNFRRNSVGLEVALLPYDWSALSIQTEFSRRKENFQDFYGYDSWKHTAELDIEPQSRHSTKISFTYRSKDYDNYYTSNIGTNNRILIEYAILRIQHSYELTDAVSILLHLRNFNKVSNDPDFDYSDLSIGTGIRIEI